MSRRSPEHQRRVLDVRRSSAAAPHRDRSKYSRKDDWLSADREEPLCSMCDSAAVRYWYPGPMCASCHRDWAE